MHRWKFEASIEETNAQVTPEATEVPAEAEETAEVAFEAPEIAIQEEAVETPTEGAVVARKKNLPAVGIEAAAEVSAVFEVSADASAISEIEASTADAKGSKILA